MYLFYKTSNLAMLFMQLYAILRKNDLLKANYFYKKNIKKNKTDTLFQI